MIRIATICLLLFSSIQAKAWWDPGHLVVAMIAYMQLDDTAKAKVDSLTSVVQRDYPYINHFITLGGWPDDLKAEGVHAFDPWHYCNIPYNPDGVVLPAQPEINVIWAIEKMEEVLRSEVSRPVDKSRHLGFLVHFVGDVHQPLHSTSYYSDKNPSGDRGGNEFRLKGPYRNMHMLWDDGCGYLSSYNDISPYGVPKAALTEEDIERYKLLAEQLLADSEGANCLDQMDPDFWALESHKLAVQYGYAGIVGQDDKGRDLTIRYNDEPSELYLENGQRVVKERLVTAGLRLGKMLNDIFGEG